MTRPVLHYAAPSGWVNDPLALTFHDGRYHLFFQYVPDSTVWTPACRWGHATSDDLLTWQTEPVALEPGDGEDGVWSGNLVRPAPGEAVVFYTAIDADDREFGRVRRAVPEDETWEKWRKEEVVVRLPEGEDAVAFRDPFVHRHGAGWRMLVGGGLRSGEAVAWQFVSEDLRTWTYAGHAASRSGADDTGGDWAGSVWECPVLVEVDGRTALVVSAWEPGVPHYLAYAFCEDRGEALDLGTWRRLSYGPSLYAASTFTDADGEPGLIAWLREVGDVDAGWMGAHSLPCRLSVVGDRLVVGPPPVVAERRSSPLGGEALPEVADLEWTPGPGERLTAAGRFAVGTGADSVTVTSGPHRVEMPWGGEPLRIVVDGPVLEVFGERGLLALPVQATAGALTVSGARAAVYALR